MRKNYQKPCLVGWREWVSLPELGIHKIKAKVDTGARTSSLHAFDIKEEKIGSEIWVKFKVHILQRSTQHTVASRSRLMDFRYVKDSGGRITLRPVILTEIHLGSQSWMIELTLIARDEMGFRMLLGRQALRPFCWVDPSASFLMGQGI